MSYLAHLLLPCISIACVADSQIVTMFYFECLRLRADVASGVRTFSGKKILI